MTIPALIATNLLIGASVAFGARVQIRTLQRHVFSTRYFIALMMLELMIVVPMGIYFYVFYPDWSWMYLVDSQELPQGVGAMTIIAYPVAGAMGYLVGYYSARSSSDFVTALFMAFMGLGILGLFVAAKNQFLWVGTYAQFHRDVGLKFITTTSLVPSSTLALVGLGSCWGYLMFRFVKEGRMRSQIH